VGLSQKSDEAYTSFKTVKNIFPGSFLVSFDEGIKKGYK